MWISENSQTGTVADEPIVKFVTVSSSSEIAAARIPAPSTAGRMMGAVIVRNTRGRAAPRSRAASAIFGSRLSSRVLTTMTM